MARYSQHELRKMISERVTIAGVCHIEVDSEVARQLAEWAIGLVEKHSNEGYLAGYNDGYQDALDGKENRHAE